MSLPIESVPFVLDSCFTNPALELWSGIKYYYTYLFILHMKTNLSTLRTKRST